MKPTHSFLPFLLVLTACTSVFSPPTPTPTSTPTLTSTPSPTSTPTFTASAIRTPPALPGPYTSALLDPPHTYLSDTCQALQDRWNSGNSAPGTVAIAIMFHSITSGPVTAVDQISVEAFRGLMDRLHAEGFQAVTTLQLADFLERNAPIPPRSVLLVVDDRRTRQYYDEWFRPYRDEWGWPVVNAWISTDQSSEDLWQQQVDLEAEGWVDHQAHGVIHNTPMWPGASPEYILGELQGSIDIFQTRFGKSPTAIIWPGGGFSAESVATARRLGYRLGFTTSPRGPLMFDWVPLADAEDPRRPSWTPEGGMNDPLLVLPRYWSSDAALHLDEVIQIGAEAAAYAEGNKATELEYYDIVCAPAYGPIP